VGTLLLLRHAGILTIYLYYAATDGGLGLPAATAAST
jgi:hypothetical protein